MEIKVHIEGVIDVDDNATEEQIQEAVEFAVGLTGQMALDNPVGMDLEWVEGNVDVEL